jgi:hypothetical protein
MADFIKLNGIWVPTPASFDWQMSDLDSSAERSASGYVIRERIRSGVRKTTFNWSSMADMEKFYNFIKILEQLPPEFEMMFPDATGEILTKTMYRADVTANMYKYADNKSYWKDLKTSFVEV